MIMRPVSFAAGLLVIICLATAAWAEPRHGIAMHGQPALPPGFTHLPEANPDAPRGGSLRLAVTGSFDNLNPFIIKGQRAGAVRDFVFESLLARSLSEPFTLYGLLAHSIDVSDDRTRVVFNLNPKARFSDGTPVTADDVVFSLETLRDMGRPHYATYYGKVKKTIVHDRHTVEMLLEPGDRELVLIVGLMPILPRHFYASHDFASTTLAPVIGSGPYTIVNVDPGRRVVFNRNPDYWASNLPVNRGRWNFDSISIDYYRDNQTAFEALKKNLIDVREESDPVRWATGYDFPAVNSGRFIRETVELRQPAPAMSLVFNTRREMFADPLVRQALIHAFDFEWANANLFHGQFERNQGIFSGSMLSAAGNPASPAERSLLEQIGADIPEDLLNGTYRAPKSDGSGRDRNNMRKALTLLSQAGWKPEGTQLVNQQTGEPFRFTLHVTTSEQERLALHFQRSLRQIGVAMDIRLIDSSQYQRRLQTFDFDMLQFTWFNSLSPGNEQALYWGSDAASQQGSRNYPGIRSPQIDATIEALVAARSKADFTNAARALDRLIVAGAYFIPLYHPKGQWIGRWAHIRHPENPSLYGFQASTAWYRNSL